MKYDKLVRDNIPKIIRKKGGVPITHIAADDEEYWRKLKDKLWEEVDEALQDPTPGEIADILEVIEAICEYMGFDKDEIQDIKEKKATERGKFKERIILEES